MKKGAYLAILLCGLAVGSLFYYRICFKPDLISMNMFITPAGNPAVRVYVENNAYLVTIDLGSKFYFSFKDSVFEEIANKQLDSLAKWRDAKGNFYEASSYRLPIVKMGNLSLKNVLAKKESKDYHINTTVWSDRAPFQVYENEPIGSLGRPILEKTNLLFDFQNLKLIASNNLNCLKKLYIDNMTSIPFELDAKGIFLIAKTDIGELRLLLDTGASISFINASCVLDQECSTDRRGFKTYTTQQFQLGDHDFGSHNLLLYEFSPELNNVDGIIGMEFLDNRIMYIDYPSRMIYLSEKK